MTCNAPVAALSIHDLRKSFVAPDGQRLPVVHVERLELAPGEQLALEGPSGAGKTTLLHLIAGILRPDAGRILVAGEDLSGAPESRRDRIRATHIGYVFQSFNLLQGHTALENVALATMLAGHTDWRAAADALRAVGLGDRLGYRPRHLSTGQQQRVAVARALVNRPALVLADEPTGNLDPRNAGDVIELIRRICRERGTGLLLVSHDRDVLARFEHVVALQALRLAPPPTGDARPPDPPGRPAPAVRSGTIAALAPVPLLARRSLRQHALSSATTAFSTALAAGLVLAVFGVTAQATRAFTGGTLGFDAILGARGSPLQLVLNTVFHLETSPGNVPWHLYEALRDDPRVALALPYAVGDSYRGFRVVGTTAEAFSRFEFQRGKRFAVDPPGRCFDAERREAVVGSFVAQETGLRVGSSFHPTHGVGAHDGHEHAEDYLVVGVLSPTNSPADRVIWIPIEGVMRMSGHVLRGAGQTFEPRPGEPIPPEHKEVSAVVVQLKTDAAGFSLAQAFNTPQGSTTFVWPISTVMADFFRKIGWFAQVLALVAYLVVAVAGASILAAVYNTIRERQRDFAILRAVGARRATLVVTILAESGAIAAVGASAGFAVYAGIMLAAASAVRSRTGVVLDPWAPHVAMLIAPLCIAALGVVAGLWPALRAYATDVASNLAPTS